MSIAALPHPSRQPHPALGLIVALAVTYGVAFLGGLARPDAWFDSIAKPAWNPPDWVFGPVWSILYTLMAIAAWLVWRDHGFKNARAALVLYAVQLALNGLWSPLFFGLHRPDLALIDIILLWLAIVATTVLFFRRHQAAGWLFVPYLAWVSFAAALNFAIWRLNA